MKSKDFLAGWEQVDITPEEPVCLCGQFHARISEGIKDPITATVVFFESKTDEKTSIAVMISCDLVAIPEEFRKAIVKKATRLIPDLREEEIIISATHTHTAPEVGEDILRGTRGMTIKDIYGVELPVMKISNYIDFASTKIAGGIKSAWEKRGKSGIGYGQGFAVVGFNRRVAYYDGHAKMYGNTSDKNFSHIEGYEDHTLNIMCTFDPDKKLTGLVINISCPSQVDEQLFLISADFWHQVRQEIKRRLGNEIFVLGQCSAAGDISPHVLLCKQTHQRMLRLSERDERQDIAIRIADGLLRILPDIEKEINYQPEFDMTHKKIFLSPYKVEQQDIKEFSEEAKKFYKQYLLLKKEIEENPEKKRQARWYVDITSNFRRYRWYNACIERAKKISKNPKIPVDIYVLRIGDIVFAPNPFELYLDYGIRIKAQSAATQTFIVQLAGGGTYLPTQRAVKGRSYGAIGPSCLVGPEGGKEFVEKTLEMINNLWSEK
ncbi:MAG: hypothetical protein N2115_02745 [bacterium]|nr:hypothetical protein [bacterium]